MSGTKTKHEFSPCAQRVVDHYFPAYNQKGDRKTPADFQYKMRLCQIELIHCHFERMTDIEKSRAAATIRFLQAENERQAAR